MEIAHPHRDAATDAHAHSGDLSVRAALKFAWAAWLTMLALPFLMFLGVVLHLLGDHPEASEPMSQTWFVISMAWLGLAVPTAFFLRSRQFKAYWTGEVVSPASYIKGMLIVWGTIEIGGLIALFGCYISHMLVPNILPAMVAFVLYIPFWPTGRAMTRATGHHTDPELYEHPR